MKKVKTYYKLIIYPQNTQNKQLTHDISRMKKANELIIEASLKWRHNERDGILNHQRLVCSTVCSGTDQRKHQSFASLAFVRIP